MGLLTAVLIGFGAAAAAPFACRGPSRRAAWIAAAAPAVITVLLAFYAPRVWAGEAVTSAFDWVAPLGLSLSFRVDGLALLFALLIAGVGAPVMVYSGEYVAGRPDSSRFFALMLLFMASMLGLALAGNLLLLYVFWELTTISSFLLIGFDHEEELARAAAIEALLVTFAGGLALLAGILLLGGVAGTLETGELIARAGVIRAHPLYPAVLALFITGAAAKSAQVPLHFWLLRSGRTERCAAARRSGMKPDAPGRYAGFRR